MLPYVIRPEHPAPFGMDRDIMLSLANYLKLDLNFIFAKKIPHIVQLIVKGQVDMSISHASQLYGFYSKGVDVSQTLRTKSFIFAIGHDVATDNYATVIIRPFTTTMWLLTLTSSIVVTLLIGSLNR